MKFSMLAIALPALALAEQPVATGQTLTQTIILATSQPSGSPPAAAGFNATLALGTGSAAPPRPTGTGTGPGSGSGSPSGTTFGPTLVPTSASPSHTAAPNAGFALDASKVALGGVAGMLAVALM